jgi:hypothetical protein
MQFIKKSYNHATVLAVSRWHLTPEAQIDPRPLHEICGRKSGTQRGLSLITSVFPCQYNSSNVLYLHFIHLPAMVYNKSPAQMNSIVSTTKRSFSTPASALADILL